MSLTLQFKIKRDLSAQALADITRKIETVISKSAFDVEGEAKSLAPVDTGFLRNSIHVENGNTPLFKMIVVGAEYGIFLETGTRRMRAQPFLTPAMERVRPEFIQAIKQAIKAR